MPNYNCDPCNDPNSFRMLGDESMWKRLLLKALCKIAGVQYIDGQLVVEGKGALVLYKRDTGYAAVVSDSDRLPVEATLKDATVSVTNFPDDQHINGQVVVNNFPDPQTVTGAVQIQNFPTPYPVVGSVEVSNLPSTQHVSGTVEVSRFPLYPEVPGATQCQYIYTLNKLTSEVYKTSSGTVLATKTYTHSGNNVVLEVWT